MPQFICADCVSRLAATVAFRYDVHRAQQMLEQHFRNDLHRNESLAEGNEAADDPNNMSIKIEECTMIEPIEVAEDEEEEEVDDVDAMEMIVDSPPNPAEVAGDGIDVKRPHACHICKKTFQSASNRNIHLQSHNKGWFFSFILFFSIMNCVQQKTHSNVTYAVRDLRAISI